MKPGIWRNSPPLQQMLGVAGVPRISFGTHRALLRRASFRRDGPAFALTGERQRDMQEAKPEQRRHFPVHFGGRFSRNAESPSRKSLVCRMEAFASMAISSSRSISAAV